MYSYKELYIIDFTKVEYYSDVHRIIKEAFDFPEYYGNNSSALWDCLTDMLGRSINIRILGFDILENKFTSTAGGIKEVFLRLKNYDNGKYAKDVNVTLCYKDKEIKL